MLCFILLILKKNKLQNSHEVIFFTDKMTGPIVGKSFVFGACDEVRVHKFVKRLSGKVHLVRYVTL